MAQISIANFRDNDKFLRLGKGIGKLEGNKSIKTWKLLHEDVSLPAAVLDMEKFQHNLAWMEEFLTKFEAPIQLASHGKTSMMPNLFNQVCSMPSTWGITLATASQAKVAHEFGTSKVLMANQLVGKRNMEIISEIFEQDDNFEFMCIIDSAKNVKNLGDFFSSRNQQLKLLIEYGPPNGRTGIRNEAQEAELLNTLKTWTGTLELVGVEFFEGVLSNEDEVSEFIDFVLQRTTHLMQTQSFSQDTPIKVTGSGSAWFDLVAEKLTKFYQQYSPINPLQIILRPGCYMIHDVGMYTSITSRIQAKQLMTTELKPALKLWAYVTSIPEKDLAIIGLGRRDTGNDCGFPKPSFHFRPEGPEKVVDPHWELFRMMDQHSFMRIRDGDDILVGDVIILDIIHACTTLDKWRNVVIIDNQRELAVLDVYQTFF